MSTPGTSSTNDESAPEGAITPLPYSEHYHGSIWHFTDANALVSIVEKQELWASAATMLNDPEELVYGAGRIVDWYEAHGDALPQNLGLHMQLTEILKDNFVERVQENPAYVVCASTDYRVLNQWRNYGSTSGVSIRLEPHAPLVHDDAEEPVFRFLPQWVAVEYRPEAQDARISRVLADIGTGRLRNVVANHPGIANMLIRGTLASLAASMKDPAYAEEKEVRLVVHLPDGSRPHHRGSSRGVIPFLRITHIPMLGWELPGLPPVGKKIGLPIQEVRVGPPDGESERQRIIGVKSLLNTHGIEAAVNGSTIRYLPVQ
ncbi:DUF2971 domain-containing protein [Microbacterium sp. C5A9]|uniref:DUF2971 domain-containing protein n=1 Tax=Microbacterium sp. C5A9 TaxID=2736663 RepID=UPI001F517907|nr:DUF2971 domain-containing protein [Microbacterium sp. C5A9]MCI1018330.1 DUF2971 domain-containing protein [Microbacterium sp. C5A9]